ncbi:hypothetical protein [Vagococcus salmoninarum]|uniref:hypothetical protein n=2 Tax=Vagococcus salmoninarum TaxID=2739 RepID=UPI003F9E44AC
MNKLVILFGVLLVLSSCRESKQLSPNDSEEFAIESFETYPAVAEDLTNAHIYQVLRNGRTQAQGMFIFEGQKLRVYKTYTPPNPNLSAEKLKNIQEQIVIELGLNDYSEFEEVFEKTYDHVEITTKNNHFYLTVSDRTYELIKIGPNRLKDPLGIEYEIR